MKKVFIEILQDGGSSLVNKIPVPKSLHGDRCFDTNWFASINWNKDFTAESSTTLDQTCI